MASDAERLKTQIGTWYVRDQRGYRLKVQYELGKPFGLKEGASNVYQEGRGAETLLAAVKASRNKIVALVGGFRVLGEKRAPIMAAYAEAKAAGGILFDPLTGRRSDQDSAEMLNAVLAKVHAELRTPPEGFEAIGRRGGENRWKSVIENRVPIASARKAWFDHKAFASDALVVEFLGLGWSRSTLLNAFGPSGRRIGRRRATRLLNEGYVGPGDIYFVRAGNHVKIGHSKSHQGRLASLKTGNHEDLKVIGIVPGAPEDEKKMHKRFQKYRVRGEWFKIEGELATFLRDLQKMTKVTIKRKRK